MLFRLNACVLAALALAACGSGAGGGSAGADGGRDGGVPAKASHGAVNVAQFELTTGFQWVANAAFLPMGTSTEEDPRCSLSVNGECRITDCTSDGGAVIDDAGVPVSAGAISASVAGQDLPVALRTDGTYGGSALAAQAWWDGGEPVTLTVAGTDGGAPAFTASFAAPSRVRLTSPVNDGGSVGITRGQPLSLGWGINSGEVQVILSTGAVQAICTVPASMGFFNVPYGVTQLLTPGPGVLSLQNQTMSLVTVGEWSMSASATSIAAARATLVQ